MIRRTFLVALGVGVSGCIGSTKSNIEKNHEEQEPEYLGTHSSHGVDFNYLDFVIESGANPEIRVYSSVNLYDSRAQIFFYNNSELVGAGAQNIETYSTIPSEGSTSYDLLLLPPFEKMKEFDAYRIAILDDEIGTETETNIEPPYVGPGTETFPNNESSCEPENVSPEDDDPMKPNCDVVSNPYASSNNPNEDETEFDILKPIPGFEPIQKEV